MPAWWLHGDAEANTDDAGDNTDNPGAIILPRTGMLQLVNE